MSLTKFLEKIKSHPEEIDFNELMDLIAVHYRFTPSAFDNGSLHNKAGENSGSCKLFSFAKLHGLSQSQTLACFGAYYREDVLHNPDADNHQNIRHFMKTGWDGIILEKSALI